MSFVVADLGGTFLRCAVAAADGSVDAIERWTLSDDERFAGERRWPGIASAIADFSYRTTGARSRRVVVAFPGPLRDGIPWIAPTVSGSAPVPDLCAMVGRATGAHCVLLNDVSAAAWHFSMRLPVSRFGVVTVSSGIGFKIFDRGADGCVHDGAGEIGHVVVDDGPNAAVCECGGLGHLGAIASGRAIESAVRAAAVRDPAGFARSPCAAAVTPASITNEKDIVPALRAGDGWTRAILATAVRPLAQTLAIIAVANGLERIAVMGGFAEAAGSAFLDLLRDAVGRQIDDGPAQISRDLFVLAGADEHASLRGAAVFGALRLAA